MLRFGTQTPQDYKPLDPYRHSHGKAEKNFLQFLLGVIYNVNVYGLKDELSTVATQIPDKFA